MPKYVMPKIEIDFSPWENMVTEFRQGLTRISEKLASHQAKKSLFESYPNATHIFDIEVFDEYGPEVWPQARYLVHGFDDVMWTNSAKQAAKFLRKSLECAKTDNDS